MEFGRGVYRSTLLCVSRHFAQIDFFVAAEETARAVLSDSFSKRRTLNDISNRVLRAIMLDGFDEARKRGEEGWGELGVLLTRT